MSEAHRTRHLGIPAALAGVAVCAAIAAAPATAATGGATPPQVDGSPEVTEPKGPVGKAKLKNGKAIAPVNAPKRVRRAIAFANRIRKKPYRWGGGHKSWKIDKAYDCSGAVSYALHGARMLASPVPSGSLRSWGKRGKGRWITVYAHGGHTYAMIAGLRWDTAGNERGSGPRWHKSNRSTKGYAVRHFPGF